MCLGLSYIGLAGARKEKDETDAAGPSPPLATIETPVPELDETLLGASTAKQEASSESLASAAASSGKGGGFLPGLLLCVFSGVGWLGIGV